MSADQARDVRAFRRVIARDLHGQDLDELDGWAYAVALPAQVITAGIVTGFVPDASVYAPADLVADAVQWAFPVKFARCQRCGQSVLVAGNPDAQAAVLCRHCTQADPKFVPSPHHARCAHCGSWNTRPQHAFNGGPPTSLACLTCGGISYPFD